MKINLPKRINWSQIMKITFSQLLIPLVFCGISYAKNSNAQNLLNKHVSIIVHNTSLETVLKKLERQASVKFVYSLNVIDTREKVSLSARDLRLDSVLNDLFSRGNIFYQVINDRIVLGYKNASESTNLFRKVSMDTALKDSAEFRVTGTVTDDQGVPLPGVIVQVKGTNIGTTTDSKGIFAVEALTPNDSLVFSYIGFIGRTVAIRGRSNLTIKLQRSSNSLSNLVVIGYQTINKKDLTGAVSVVNMENSNKITSGSVGESIQGLIPGVTVRNGGAPGENPVVEIRGVGSFGNSSPLYVIDGMLADANTTVNTDDIASIQVLKDASAAAIYGSRAGNGVIIITTKKGKEGPAQFSFSAKYGVQQMPRQWNVMNAPEYLKTVQTEYQNSGINLPAGVAAQIANPSINTDWQKAVGQTGNDQAYNMNVSGGSKTSGYLISGSYYKNYGVLIGNDFQRTSLRINTEARRGRIKIGENMMISNTNSENPGGGINAFYESASMLPVIAVQGDQYKSIQYNPAGWGMGTTDLPTYASNYVAVNALDHLQHNYAKIIGNAYAELKITDWLYYRFNMGAEVSFDYNKEVRDTGIWRYTNQPPATSVSEDRELFTNFLLEHTLNFNKTFGHNTLNGVLGFSRTQQQRNFTSAGRTQLQTVNGQTFTTINSAVGTPFASGGTPVFWRAHGYLGRINYSYYDKYLLTLTGRIDQDSRFGPAFRTGYFPSASAAWRISKEDFFKIKWINDLKLRASYGKLGFSDVLGSWDYIGTLNNSPRAVYGVSQSPQVGEYQAEIANADLHWETRIQKNIGFDASLLGNKLEVTMDGYNSLSKEVLVNLPLPQYLGSIGQPSANAGSIRNTGVEFEATYRNDEHPFKWNISANLTTIKNTVLSVGNQGVSLNGSKVNYLEPTDFLRAEVGHSIGEWYVIKTDGIFQSQQEINSYVNKDGKMIQPNAKPGDIKYVDANGDGTINNDDRQFVGSPWPSLQGGAQLNASYRNFSINIQLIGVFGNTIYDDVRRVLDSYQLSNFRKDINPWSPSNTGGTDPRLAVDVPSDPEVSMNNMAQTSRWLENGSYVRIRNLELGYSFPKQMLKSLGVSNLQIYLSGQNLVTFTKYKGLDPDVTGTGIISRGFDAGNWPASRVVSIGLHLGF